MKWQLQPFAMKSLATAAAIKGILHRVFILNYVIPVLMHWAKLSANIVLRQYRAIECTH